MTIKCVWWGYPVPEVSIRKDDKALPSEDVQTEPPRLEATVNVKGDEDFTTYTCHATNVHGSASYDVTINKAGWWFCPMGREGWVTFVGSASYVTINKAGWWFCPMGREGWVSLSAHRPMM